MDDVERLLDASLKGEDVQGNGRHSRSERSDRRRSRSPGADDDARSYHSGRSHHRRHRSRSPRDRDYDRDRDREHRRRHRSPTDRDHDDEYYRDRKRRRDRDREPADDGTPNSSSRRRDRDAADAGAEGAEGVGDESKVSSSGGGRRDRDEDDYYRGERRHRDRSRDRYRGRRDDYERDDRRRRYDEPDRRRSRGSPRYDRARSPPPAANARPGSPELTEEEHEMRSVFVSQLSQRVGDRELAQFFESQAGKVREAKVITDRISRRSKGVGYVEFRELESVQKALSMSGTKLLGLPIMVQFTEAEKNRQALANGGSAVYMSANRAGGPNDPNSYARLYVGSLNFNLTDDDLRQVFQPFGPIDYVDLHKDSLTGKSKGYAFVQFRNPQDARNAMDKMNNFSLAGRALRVEIKAQPPPGLLMNDGGAGGGGFGRSGGGGGYGGSDERLEDPIGGNMNQITRIELMHKLARTDQPPSLSVTDMYRPNIPVAQTRSVLLKNMFNPEEESERGWDLELRDDVKSECETQYGPVIAIAVEKESTSGEIYITFDSIASAQKAVNGLNGRFFGGRSITATFISDALVTAHGGK